MIKDRVFFNECIKKEVYLDNHPSLHAKIWLKYFRPETNSVYLIKKVPVLNRGRYCIKIDGETYRDKANPSIQYLCG